MIYGCKVDRYSIYIYTKYEGNLKCCRKLLYFAFSNDFTKNINLKKFILWSLRFFVGKSVENSLFNILINLFNALEDVIGSKCNYILQKKL